MGDLAQCSRLRELRFSTPKRYPSCSSRWITRVLSSIRPKRVKRVVIKIACDFQGKFVGLEELREVAAALSHMTFKSVERLSVRVLGTASGGIPVWVPSTIRESFARYDSGGLLTIEGG